MPDGSTGINLGEGFFSAGLQLNHVIAEDIQSLPRNHGIAGLSQSRLNDQVLFADNNFVLESAANQLALSSDRITFGNVSADEFSIDGHASASSDGHAVQSEIDSLLSRTEESAVTDVTHEIDESWKAKNGTAVDDGAISISDLNVSGQATSPSSDRASSNSEIFKLQVVTLGGLLQQPSLLGKGGDIVGADIFATLAASGQGQNQDNQRALQHNLSFGSHTLPPDRDVVNNSEAISNQPSALSFDQLALLNRATITIADLADGYLALTLGSTITLDIDAAGYGWFIDPTPFTSEEFLPSAISHQFSADPEGLAAGKIDLMTVLMHELGHVMGLGHVSSAVDGTRLMAGSIDPGIRRLPSALDLGPVDSDHDHSPDASPLTPHESQVWAPYLAHYTVAASGEQTPAPVINPAQLVQAAQLPTHSGIFNSNFAISDPLSATFGWDESGAVTIANGQATLSENSNVISTLSQLFTLPAGSTHLRFTLLDVNLVRTGTGTGSAGASPQDAFEVAFLESSTLTPLAGVTAGLTQTDSLFNLQQDGTVRFSNRVTLSTGTLSGSTLDLTQPVIVDIDLTGITVGAGARLSFDLLGFGDHTSTVVLDNVLLTDGQPTAAPVAVNDSFTVAEGTSNLEPRTSGLLANDTDSDTSAFSLTAFSLAAPANGTLTVNADGSFTYVHNGSETTTDSFTYRVSDGINFSNLATVSLTITPTNDAPAKAEQEHLPGSLKGRRYYRPKDT